MAEQQTGVTVTGVGTVRVPTTEAGVRLQVVCREAQPGAALREAGAIVAAVLDVLRNAGIPDTAVRTDSVSLSPNTVWSDDTEHVEGYDAQQQLQVRVTDLELLDRLLGQLVDRCGAGLRIDDVSLSAEPTDEALSQARREAVADARAKASDYAEFAGRVLGRAEWITEGPEPHRPIPRRGPRLMAAGAGMPIAQGEDTTTVAVQVHWQFD